jgi:hypothetical protein
VDTATNSAVICVESAAILALAPTNISTLQPMRWLRHHADTLDAGHTRTANRVVMESADLHMLAPTLALAAASAVLSLPWWACCTGTLDPGRARAASRVVGGSTDQHQVLRPTLVTSEDSPVRVRHWWDYDADALSASHAHTVGRVAAGSTNLLVDESNKQAVEEDGHIHYPKTRGIERYTAHDRLGGATPIGSYLSYKNSNGGYMCGRNSDKQAVTFDTDATLLGVLHDALAMIATPTTDELLTTTAAAPHRMCAAPDCRCGCSCDSRSCIRHTPTRTLALKWPPVASSRVVDYRTETNTGTGTDTAARTTEPVIDLTTSTSNPTCAPKPIPAVIPTATLGTFVTVALTPATEFALKFAAPAPSPAAATVAYHTKVFYNEQHSAACNTACGSTFDQAATPVAMTAISLTPSSSGVGASRIDYEPWRQPDQHLDKRSALAFLTTTRHPALKGGSAYAKKRYPSTKGGSTNATTCGSMKWGELSGSTSPTTTLKADAKGQTERGWHTQSMGENGMDSSAGTYSTASDVATSWNATDCDYNGDDTMLGSRNDRGVSHGGYCDTTSVSADPCFAYPATFNSISFRTIGCNNSSSPLISSHWQPLLQTKLIKARPLLAMGGASREDCMMPLPAKGGEANTCTSVAPFVVRSVQST